MLASLDNDPSVPHAPGPIALDDHAPSTALEVRFGSPASDWWPRIPLSRRYRTIGTALVMSDAACAVFALLVGYLVLAGRVIPSAEMLGLMTVVPVAWVASFHAFGLYNVRHLSALEEFRRLIAATCVATSLVTLVTAWLNIPPYRKWLVITWLVAVTSELVARRLWRWQLQHLRRQGHLAARTVILGTNDESHRLARALSQPELGFHVVGHVSVEKTATPNGLRIVGTLDGLEPAIRSLGVECVFVASSTVTADNMVHVAQVARQTDVEIRTSANLVDILVSRLSVQRFGDVLSLSVKPVRMSVPKAALKRTFDVCLSSLALVITLPLMALIAVAVRLSSPGPIFFRQERVTKGGRVFVMYKFRTMTVEEASPADEPTVDRSAPFFKLTHDPRLTRAGRILRRLSFDELPQFWNVIRGDLSLVGPRPLPREQVEAHAELMRARHEVRGGITGWWQVNGRSNVEAAEAIRMDLFYIENWSLSLDLFILLKTAGTVVSRRGAC